MKRVRAFSVSYLVWLINFTFIFSTPLQALESVASHELMPIQVLKNEITLENLRTCIIETHGRAHTLGITDDALPPAFVMCSNLIENNEQVTKEDIVIAFESLVQWIKERMQHEFHTIGSHDGSSVSHGGISRGGSTPCCTATKLLNQILFLLVPLVGDIGDPGDPACAQTIFGILGDACTTLSGQSISQGIAQLEVCCEATLTTLANIETLTALGSIAIELNDTVTTLAALTVELNATLTTINAVSQELQATLTTLNSIQTSVNGTLTALNACCNSTFTALNSIQNTITSDFNQTWTILGDPAATFGKGASISSALLNILQNTSSTTNCCAATFTALAAIQNSVNGTFTAIADVKSTLTTCCNSTF